MQDLISANCPLTSTGVHAGVCICACTHMCTCTHTHTHTHTTSFFFLFCKGINLARLREINWKAGEWGHQEESEQGEGDLDKGGE